MNMRFTEDESVRWIRLQIELIDAERQMRDRELDARREQLRDLLLKGKDRLDSMCDCEEDSGCWKQDHMDRALDLNALDSQMMATHRGEYSVAVQNLSDFETWAEDRANEQRIEEEDDSDEEERIAQNVARHEQAGGS